MLFEKVPWSAIVTTSLLACLWNANPNVVAGGRLKFDQCPSVVQKTLERESFGGEIKEIEKERRRKTTTYEAELILDGKENEIVIAGDGILLRKILDDFEGRTQRTEQEIEITLGDCPIPVRKTLERESLSGKIAEIEREQSGSTIVYEADVIIDGHEYEGVILEDGTLREKSLDDDEDEED